MTSPPDRLPATSAPNVPRAERRADGRFVIRLARLKRRGRRPVVVDGPDLVDQALALGLFRSVPSGPLILLPLAADRRYDPRARLAQGGRARERRAAGGGRRRGGQRRSSAKSGDSGDDGPGEPAAAVVPAASERGRRG